MRPTWLALVAAEPSGASLRAPVREGGWLAAWDNADSAPETAWRVDPRALDPHGAETVVALAAAPAGISLPFDDPSVTGAIRAALSSEPAALCTTLLVEGRRYAGVLVAPPHLATPFATIFPQTTLHVGAGVLGRPAWPAGPGTQRYVGGVPWPWDRFEP
ncbi:MAG TPA: hypothetical protein VFM41_11430 [Gaiella sp.]|nr:hypothetical protein [Gaiella sp.]